MHENMLKHLFQVFLMFVRFNKVFCLQGFRQDPDSGFKKAWRVLSESELV